MVMRKQELVYSITVYSFFHLYTNSSICSFLIEVGVVEVAVIDVFCY